MSVGQIEENVSNITELQQGLLKVMQREVKVLRELMSNMRREQELHMNNDVAHLRPLMDERESIFHVMVEVREQRITTLQKLAQMYGFELSLEGKIDQKMSLDLLSKLKGDEAIDINLTKNQIINLLDELKNQTSRNNYLIKGKLARTRELMNRLCPKDQNTQYGSHGTQKKAAVTVKLINQEG